MRSIREIITPGIRAGKRQKALTHRNNNATILQVSAQHKPELDGIRGMAIIGVLLTHSWPYIKTTAATGKLVYLLVAAMTFGQWGVDLFFVLSGFLITGILIDTKHATNYLRSFYARRALRILPIYYGVVVMLFLLSLVVPWLAENLPLRREWAPYFVYLQNVPLFWTIGHREVTLVGHFWSLAVEEQFYLIWPFVVFFLPKRTILWICAVGCVLALPLRVYLQHHIFGMSWTAMIITTARMDGLFVGAACAILVRRFSLFPVGIAAAFTGIGVSILGWIAVFHRQGEFFGAGPYMRTFGVTAVALLSGALLGFSQRRSLLLDRFLTFSGLRFFGRYAYGLYVFHIPVYLLAGGLIAPKVGLHLPLPLKPAILFILVINAFSIALAVVSFEFFETRILRQKSRFKAKFPGVERPAGLVDETDSTSGARERPAAWRASGI
ncbi:MAG TPA: acyltransferase [Bryobacteraceae bacterium]|jgi:peptidoglycan/LPS O-acetylase OafA/YrhL